MPPAELEEGVCESAVVLEVLAGQGQLGPSSCRGEPVSMPCGAGKERAWARVEGRACPLPMPARWGAGLAVQTGEKAAAAVDMGARLASPEKRHSKEALGSVSEQMPLACGGYAGA